MKPETDAFFGKTQEFLAKAQELLDARHWPDEAGRAAYLAGFRSLAMLTVSKASPITKPARLRK